VAGGGPAGVELAGNVQGLVANDSRKHEIHLNLGGWEFGLDCPKRATTRLVLSGNRGVTGAGKRPTDRHRKEEILLETGTHWVRHRSLALGVETSTIFRNSGMPIGDDGDSWSMIICKREIPGNVRRGRLHQLSKCSPGQGRSLRCAPESGSYGNLMAALNNSPMERFIRGRSIS